MKPLDNVTVLDVTTALAGPFATLLLAGLGARVITTASTPAKAELSRQAGAVEVLDYPVDAGEFAAGSMGPKIEAAVRFIEGGGRRAVIGDLDHAPAALDGRTGTTIVGA